MLAADAFGPFPSNQDPSMHGMVGPDGVPLVAGPGSGFDFRKLQVGCRRRRRRRRLASKRSPRLDELLASPR